MLFVPQRNPTVKGQSVSKVCLVCNLQLINFVESLYYTSHPLNNVILARKVSGVEKNRTWDLALTRMALRPTGRMELSRTFIFLRCITARLNQYALAWVSNVGMATVRPRWLWSINCWCLIEYHYIIIHYIIIYYYILHSSPIRMIFFFSLVFSLFRLLYFYSSTMTTLLLSFFGILPLIDADLTHHNQLTDCECFHCTATN